MQRFFFIYRLPLSSNDRDREEKKHTTAKRDEPGVEIVSLV